MVITVTQKHIDNGRRGLMLSCPIALAIKERTGLSVVIVGRYISVYTNNIDLRQCKTSEKALGFIYDFDSGINVKPFTFECELNLE